MGDLTAEDRKQLPKAEFGEPKERKYPMPDKSHAANAKARASQQEAKGNISEATKDKIDAKADRKLGEKEGEKAPRSKSQTAGMNKHEKFAHGMASKLTK